MTEWRFIPAGAPGADSVAVFQSRANVAHLDSKYHRPRLEQAALLVVGIARRSGFDVTDLGCGDGGLLSLLPADVRGWGYDIRAASVAAARPGCDVRTGNILEPESLEIGGVVVLTETLEHLDDPADLLARLPACGAQFLVASSPAVERPDNRICQTHVWSWDVDGYRDLLKRSGWLPTGSIRVGPFQIATAHFIP